MKNGRAGVVLRFKNIMNKARVHSAMVYAIAIPVIPYVGIKIAIMITNTAKRVVIAFETTLTWPLKDNKSE